jgi:hypothetical protein
VKSRVQVLRRNALFTHLARIAHRSGHWKLKGVKEKADSGEMPGDAISMLNFQLNVREFH